MTKVESFCAVMIFLTIFAVTIFIGAGEIIKRKQCAEFILAGKSDSALAIAYCSK